MYKTSRYTFPMKKCFCVVCVVLMLLSASWLRAQEPIDFVYRDDEFRDDESRSSLSERVDVGRSV